MYDIWHTRMRRLIKQYFFDYLLCARHALVWRCRNKKPKTSPLMVLISLGKKINMLIKYQLTTCVLQKIRTGYMTNWVGACNGWSGKISMRTRWLKGSQPCEVQGEEHFSRGNVHCKGTKVGKGLECSWDWYGAGDEGRGQGNKGRIEVEL